MNVKIIRTLYWFFKHFSELTSHELYQILQLREQVFIIEQDCIYPDIDDKDLLGYHLFGIKDDQLICYSRILGPSISYLEPSIGRVLVAENYRQQGIGKQLILRGIEETKRLFPQKGIRISAQTYLLNFYSNLGFKAVGTPYDEDGIEHIEMFRP